MLCLIIYRVYKMFDWFAGDGFRCSSALCLSVSPFVKKLTMDDLGSWDGSRTNGFVEFWLKC